MIRGGVTPDTSRSRCFKTIRQGEIVVCAPDEDEFRVKSTGDEDPYSAQALNDGRPHAPDVSGLPDCRPGSRKGCIGIGSVPPPVYLIDLSSIPLAPAGSDADKIAKGEIRAP
ncbi:hypothetical protein SAMN05518801_101146 [Novosphingobium sp. CF614]|nr:hypothetical protein SAMN05518801_101146 [Novosphingobium sp. CF614]